MRKFYKSKEDISEVLLLSPAMKISEGKFLIIIAFLGLINFELKAQNHAIETAFHMGTILPIYPNYPESSGAYTFDLSYRSFGNTKNVWASLWNYPELGVNLSYVNLGNNDVLGQSLALSFQYGLSQKISKKWDLSETFNFGLAYFNNDYDYIDNPENIAVGSAVTANMRLDVKLRYHFDHAWNVFIGFSLQHNSNAHTELPNLGVNYPAIILGTQFVLKSDTSYLHTKKALFEASKKWNINARIALGINKFGTEVIPSNGPSYPIYLIALYSDYRFWRKSRLLAGLEYYYNTGYKDFLDAQKPNELKNTAWNASVVSVMFGNEFLYGHLGFVVQIGFYLHNPFLKYYNERLEDANFMDKVKAYVPGRFGFHYYMHDLYSKHKFNSFIGAYVKSNIGQADFLELTLGFQF